QMARPKRIDHFIDFSLTDRRAKERHRVRVFNDGRLDGDRHCTPPILRESICRRMTDTSGWSVDWLRFRIAVIVRANVSRSVKQDPWSIAASDSRTLAGRISPTYVDSGRDTPFRRDSSSPKAIVAPSVS